MVAPVDDGDVDIVFHRAGGPKTAEAGADDHHMTISVLFLTHLQGDSEV